MAAKKPQDRKPKTASKASKPEPHAKTDKFVYETDDAYLEIPYVENLPAPLIDELAEAETDGQSQKIIMDTLFADQRDQYAKMTIGEIMDLFQRWNSESSINLGEL